MKEVSLSMNKFKEFEEMERLVEDLGVFVKNFGEVATLNGDENLITKDEAKEIDDFRSRVEAYLDDDY